jgi:hypothetical protein
MLWIPPGCRHELARHDDVVRFAAWSLAPSDAPLLDRARGPPGDRVEGQVDVCS